MTGDFIDGSTATGLLIIIYSLTNDSNVHYISEDTDQMNMGLSVRGLTGAQYVVSTFVVDKGLPFPRVVTSPKHVTVQDSHEQEGL